MACEPDLQSLRDLIQTLSATTDFLAHRLDSVQREMEMHTFSLDTFPVKPKKHSRTHYTKKLLALIELPDKGPGLTCGAFLQALNKYLLENDYVDLNDLQIRMSPLIAMTFFIPLERSKVPYSYLLKNLPEVFE